MRGRTHRWSPSRWCERALVLVLGCVLAMPVRADEPALAAAEAAYARGALREAQRAFQSLLRQPGLDLPTLARVHLHLGILAGATGAERTASQHFAIALALEPRLEAPPELAGRDRSRFERERRTEALAISVAETDPEVVEAHVVGAPPGLVASIAVWCGDVEVATSGPPRAKAIRVTLSPERCGEADVFVAVLARDAHGHVVARAQSTRGREPRTVP